MCSLFTSGIVVRHKCYVMGNNLMFEAVEYWGEGEGGGLRFLYLLFYPQLPCPSFGYVSGILRSSTEGILGGGIVFVMCGTTLR